jgi:transcription initiation factor TFIIIB Brf1 subunit/transcription initiation factor TFIIB
MTVGGVEELIARERTASGRGRCLAVVSLLITFREDRGRVPRSVEELAEWSGVSKATLYRGQRELRRYMGQ